MAKLIISGTSATLKSGLKMADLKKISKLNDKLLSTYDEEGKPVFSFEVSNKALGSIGSHGISFNQKDKAGYAMVTINTDINFELMSKTEIAEHFMRSLADCNDLERFILEMGVPQINRRVAAVEAMIVVADEPVEMDAEPVIAEEPTVAPAE